MIISTIKAETSPICAMNSMYEAAWSRITQIEEKRPGDDEGDPRAQCMRRARLDNGTRLCLAETEALRNALFHQMPIDDADLAILLYHINDQSRVDPDSEPEDARTARVTAIEACFDYLVSAGRVSLDAMGECFRSSAIAAFHRIRVRFADDEALEMEVE